MQRRDFIRAAALAAAAAALPFEGRAAAENRELLLAFAATVVPAPQPSVWRDSPAVDTLLERYAGLAESERAGHDGALRSLNAAAAENRGRGFTALDAEARAAEGETT